jgi:hypothetical protein
MFRCGLLLGGGLLGRGLRCYRLRRRRLLRRRLLLWGRLLPGERLQQIRLIGHRLQYRRLRGHRLQQRLRLGAALLGNCLRRTETADQRHHNHHGESDTASKRNHVDESTACVSLRIPSHASTRGRRGKVQQVRGKESSVKCSVPLHG